MPSILDSAGVGGSNTALSAILGQAHQQSDPVQDATGLTQDQASAGLPRGGILGSYDPFHPQQGDNLNALGVPIGSKDYAVRTQAAVARQNYADYKSTFLPLQKYLADTVNNPAYFGAQVGDSLNQFNQTFEASEGQYQRDLGRYGLTQTADQKVSQDRLADQAHSTGQVEALNRSNRGYRDLEYAILGAGASTANPSSQSSQSTLGGGR